MRLTPPSRLLVALVLALIAGPVLVEPANGQEGRRGRGGFGGRGFGGGGFGGFERGGGGMLGTLRDESVQQELGLTDEQKTKIEEISASARPSGDVFAQFRELRDLSDEEREARMAEFRQQAEDRRREAEGKLKEVLKEEQFTRLQQISLRNAGARGLLQDDVAAELKLSDEQKTQIREILESREGFGDFRSMTPEDFQRIREEREAKALTVLNDEQKQAWEKKLGPAPEEGGEATADRDSGERPDRRSSDRPPRTAASNTDSGTVILPDGTSRSPMSSFGGSEQQANAESAPSEAKRLSFNFYQAPWADVLRLFASVAGLTIDLKDVPPGTFSYYDPNEYTPTEALDIINGYLLPRGHILVRRDNFLVSLNIDDGVPPNLVPTIKMSELTNRGRNELVGVILPLQQGLDPEKISKEVEGLLGPQGKVVPLVSSNSLMLQDLASNLREVTQLLSDISIPQSDDELVFKRIPLQHMVATEAERQIRRLFGLDSSTRNVSRAAESSRGSSGMASFFERFRRGGDNDRDRGSSSSNSSSMLQAMQAMTPQIHVSSDPRTNSVLVKAKAADMKLIEEMLEAIDVPESDDAKRIAGNNTPVLRVYTLGEAEADEVAKTLDAIMPGVVINEDGRNDMIHVMATPLEHEEIELLVQRLDGRGGQSIDVIRLTRTDPTMMAQLLSNVFVNVDRDIAPVIQADPISRSLIVRASTEQMGEIRRALMQFGEDGAGGSALSRQGGRFRSVPLAGRDPERVARIVEGVLSGSSEFSNEIRVVVPSDGPVRDTRVPSATRREAPARTRETRRSADRELDPSLRTHRVNRPSVFMASLKDEAADESQDAASEYEPAERGADTVTESTDSAPQQDEPRSGRGRGAPRVNIEVRGDELFLYSADENALDQVEGLIDELAQRLPAQSDWTIFYLRIADAMEAATLLEQLVASNSLMSSSSSSSSWGYSRYSRSTPAPIQTLKIIPDTRTNSLFVSGPSDKVREVEQFLRLIDAAETPESLRDRLPRSIPVRHADVLQVAQMIRDVYKDYMEDPNSRDRDRGRSSFSFFGGSSSGRSNVRLTLAVDTQASELIVSCDDPLFREIEELVYQRDEAALEAEPTVQVVELNPASAAMVQQALTSLSPKILVSTSGTPRPGTQNQTDSNANRSSQSSSDDRSSDDARRDFFRRMMESRSSDSSRSSGSSWSDRSRSDSGSSGRWGSGGSSDWRSRFGGGDSSRWSRSRGRD